MRNVFIITWGWLCGCSKKGQRKIVRNDRIFYWCVKNDDEDEDRIYLNIKSDDKKFMVSYMLRQKDVKCIVTPQNPVIIVKGKGFKGVNDLGGSWERFLVPEWEDEIVTPSLVAQIIDWCFTVEEVTCVDYRGEISSH